MDKEPSQRQGAKALGLKGKKIITRRETSMIEASYHFPRGFLWGCATASHQVEGNNTLNSWYWWEQQEGKILRGDRSGLACDWWGGRWREDFDRAADGGQNAHRMSLEWSRVQPTPDRWDEDAIEHYRQMLRGLQERKLTPLVTLHHFSEPMWFLEMGAWENAEAVKLFVGYVRKMVESLKEYVNLWVTFNEPNLYIIFGYIQGIWPPGKTDFQLAIRAANHLVEAHAEAYSAIHTLQPTARVGMAHHFLAIQPAKDWSPFDRLASGLLHSSLNELITTPLQSGTLKFLTLRYRIPKAKGTQDFLGLNYYSRSFVAFDLFKPQEMFARRFYRKDAELSDGGHLANEPEGFAQAIRWAHRFNLPIIITENGVNDMEDRLRPRYILEHLHQLWRAVNFNFPIKGYFHWSLVDNFEWERGWTQRFGLWALDEQTQQRTRRPSANLYADICRENGITTDMVSKYAPTILQRIFPAEF